MNKDIEYYKTKLLEFLKEKYLDENGKFQKSRGYSVGTIRDRKGGRYKKISEGKWIRVASGNKDIKNDVEKIRNILNKIKTANTMNDLNIIVENNRDIFENKNNKGKYDSLFVEISNKSDQIKGDKSTIKENPVKTWQKQTYGKVVKFDEVLKEYEKNPKKYPLNDMAKWYIEKKKKGEKLDKYTQDMYEATIIDIIMAINNKEKNNG